MKIHLLPRIDTMMVIKECNLMFKNFGEPDTSKQTVVAQNLLGRFLRDGLPRAVSIN